MLSSLSVRRALLGVVATLATTAALLTTGVAMAGPGYHAPALGDCHAIDLAHSQKKADPSDPVPCSSAHTARVIKVAKLPAGVSWSVSAAKLFKIASHKCIPTFMATLGRTDKVRDRSAYSWLYFQPTQAEIDHGARWIRCDVALLGGTELVNLPTDATPALPKPPLPDSVARCETGKYAQTTCARTHAWRSAGTFRIDQKAYPSQQQLQHAAERRCPAIAGTAYWRWSAQGAVSWSLGDHFVVCYSQTTS
ncbi:septum formation family protein [Nocardioides sp. LS1]|uniref:septum formation family protein n=1 Tax=Nocardioides sp. LS1 TaxID=1027620 RepID=UPI000FFA3847|nr:septum formation family protein [Nocardioides sp. LS1]GCD90529.1 hypothetical protein NLS1_25350 [Nocardioides sp. LS1]